jgi:hypothetical protein
MLTNLRISKVAIGAGVALFTTALLCAGALAVTSPTQTRETYVAQVEPICKTNTKSNERILQGVEKKVKQGKLQVAAGQFTQASIAFGKAVKQLKAVPQPVADEAKLTKWLSYLDAETKYLSDIGKALKAGNKGKAQTLSVKLTHNGSLANNTVLSFEFNYCEIESSRFS